MRMAETNSNQDKKTARMMSSHLTQKQLIEEGEIGMTEW